MPDTITLQERIGLGTVKPTKITMKQPTNLSEVSSDALIGIEVEVEQHDINNRPHAAWVVKEDGSLRNNGAEYVSAPIKASDAPAMLDNLFTHSLSPSCSFSMRTSIHVHLNASDMNIQQMQAVVLLYTVFESVFYNYAGRGRAKNIYCVPITQTDLLTYFQEQQLRFKWQKYTGLNLLRLMDLGTIEFRHLAGTSDPERITNWIGIICRFREYVMNHPNLDALTKLIAELDERSDYYTLLTDILGPYMQFVKFEEQEKYSHAALKVKTAFLKRGVTQQFYKDMSSDSPIYKVYRAVAL